MSPKCSAPWAPAPNNNPVRFQGSKSPSTGNSHDQNPCPENLIVEACCGQPGQVFTGALPGVVVGDTFVDTYGFCWQVIGTTPSPISYIIYVDTVYTETDCADATCTDDNVCPEVVSIESCCEQFTSCTY